MKVGLAPLFGRHSWVHARYVVGELIDPLIGDNAGSVDLMTAAIIKILSSQQLASLVTASASCVPLEDIDDLLVGPWSIGAIDEDSAATHRLTDLGKRQGNMSVLQVLHGDVITWCRLRPRISCSRIRLALRRVAEEIVTIYAWSPRGKCRKKPHVAVAIKSRIGASHIATGVAMAYEHAVPDDGHLLDPAVADDRTNDSGQEKTLHGGLHIENVGKIMNLK